MCRIQGGLGTEMGYYIVFISVLSHETENHCSINQFIQYLIKGTYHYIIILIHLFFSYQSLPLFYQKKKGSIFGLFVWSDIAV